MQTSNSKNQASAAHDVRSGQCPTLRPGTVNTGFDANLMLAKVRPSAAVMAPAGTFECLP